MGRSVNDISAWLRLEGLGWSTDSLIQKDKTHTVCVISSITMTLQGIRTLGFAA